MKITKQLPLPALIVTIFLVILALPFVIAVVIVALIYIFLTKRKIKKMFNAELNQNKQDPHNNSSGRIINQEEV